AADIVTSTLQGGYIVDAGELNLHQDETDYVDLNASIDINGGTMNVYGGYPIDSYWPWTQNAYITMSGGVLDFKDNGIYLNETAYTLTDNITGGIIRTSGNFHGSRQDFNPTGGTIELYGDSDAMLGHGIGSSFHDVVINKGTAIMGGGRVAGLEKGRAGRKSIADIDAEQNIRYRHDGTSYPQSRMNSVTVISTLDIDNDLVFDAGFFNPDGNTVDMDGDFDISGTLSMDSDDYIRAGNDILWRDGSQCSAQGGEFHCERNWVFDDGCNVPLQSVVPVYMDGMNPGEIHNYSNSLNARFGELVIDKFQGGVVTLAESGYPIEALQLRCTPSDTIEGGSSTLEVENLLWLEYGAVFNSDPDGVIYCDDITIEGHLDLGMGSLTVHDQFLLQSFGSMNLAGGQVICDRAFSANYMIINGDLNFSDGLFEVTSEGLQIGGGNGSTISGGTVRLGWALRSIYENGLQPTGGVVEFTGSTESEILVTAGNYLHDLTIDKTGGSVSTTNPLSINGELHLVNQTLNMMGNDLTIAGDLLIETGGQLDPDDGSVSVGLNWTNLRGDQGFVQGNSSVTFTGDLPAAIHSDESFYDLTVEKPTSIGYYFEIADALTVDVLGDLQIYTGPLMLHDDVSLDVEGDISINGGAGLCAYPLYNGIEIDCGGSWFDYNSTYDYRVGFNPGSSLVTFDGSGEQLIETWPTAEFWDLSIDKASGSLIRDCNLWIQHDFNLLSGNLASFSYPVVTHYFEGDIYQAPGTEWYDYSATICLIGTAEQLIDLQGMYQFAELLVDKMEPELLDDPAADLAADNITGEPVLTREGRTEAAILQNDLALSKLVMDYGTLQLNGNTLSLNGWPACTIDPEGVLNLSAGSQLLLFDNNQLTVNGRLELLGSQAEPAVLSHSSTGYYYFDVSDGGTLSAEHALFEYMQGINITETGNLDPVHTLHYCTFQQSQWYGTLLQIDNNQPGLVINGAHFPNNTWYGAYNVGRTVFHDPMEPITFAGATGGFSGPEFMNDPYESIDWTIGGDPDLQVTDLYWSETDPYVLDFVELHYTIANNGDVPSGQFTLGFYNDLTVPPTIGDTPDTTEVVSSIAPGGTYSFSTWITSETAAEWSSWLLADCQAEVAESDEGNNYGGPEPISWLPLPPVS
ncbi:MAG: hypothetical protein K8R46_13845, partial [Pirellulales bacterium]|nr:hypothetical protein [Pirellulales bacterium]